ncbi:nucleotidyltransferase family protein [Sphingopyxis sp.]|uniref:nucleotidyltransferase family protein n=1 Tax=Sphingopyxis sp. TaxID=1908224 RepID=UPI0025E2AC5D|nr:nucleotidyltransferase family protein [Sphingopyxis sp.]MBK6413052.1 nucleotidyltransferase family protein [Sphingopyxis sp.]
MIDPADVAVLLLAAGQSGRFGSDKLLVPLGGAPMALHAANRLAELGTGWRIAVCREAGSLARELEALGFEVVVNPEPSRGLSSSLALGIERAETVGAKAALVALGDMPFVSPAHFAALVAAFDPATAPIVASDRAGVAMPPAVFDKTVFADLRNGEGDQGARALIRGAALVAADPHELADIDRPEDIR